MSYESSALNYVGLYEEPNGSYQVDHSGTPGDFVPMPYVEGSLDLKGAEADLDPQTGKMRLDGMDVTVLGVRSCSAAWTTRVHSHGQDLDGNVTPVTKSAWALLRALQTIMGGMVATTNKSAQTEVQSGSTTATAVEVTSGHGDRFQAGGVIGCEITAGLIEAREVLSVAGDVVSVKEAFSGVPITDSVVRGGITVYLTEDPNSSLQVLREGREAQDGSWFGGLQGGFTLQLPAGELGDFQFALQGAAWDEVGSSSATIPSYSNFSPMALSPLEVTVPTVGDTTRVVLEQSDIVITPGITYGPVKSGRAANTIARMRRAATRGIVKGTFTIPKEDQTWFTARADREVRALFAQLGNVPGSTVLISVPTIQIGMPADAQSGENIRGIQVPFVARHDEEIGSTTEISYSALRIHFL